MRLRRLVIHNIASIADAEINFDAAPLDGSDVFLICGETGAGKSTILDAICLALFGTVPRLGTGRADDYDAIRANDQRQLLRAGCGEGFVTLDFLGNDGHDYTAEWRVRKARNKASGKFQDVERSLICDGNRTGAVTKLRQVDAAVQSALGIDYEQFVRTSMLAQGEFTRFLKADDTEKSAILEKLTGTSVYTRIGAEIYRLTDERRKAYEAVKARIDSSALMSDEDIATVRRRIADIIAQSDERNAALRDLSARLTRVERETELRRLLAEAEQLLAEKTQRRDSADTAALRRMAERWRTLEPQRTIINNIRTARLEADDAREALALQRPRLAEALGCLGRLKDNLDRHIGRHGELQERLKAHDGRTTVYVHWPEIVSTLDAVMASRAATTTSEKTVAETNEAMEKATASLAKLKEEVAAATARCTALAETVADTDRRIAALKAPDAVTARQTAVERRSACLNLMQRRQALARSVARLADERTALTEAVKILKEKQAAVTPSEHALTEVRARAESSRKLFEIVDFSRQSWAATARAALTEGCTCPVCRQRVDLLPPAEEVLVEQWKAVRAQADEDAHEAERQNSAHSALLAAVDSETKRIQAETQRLESAETDIHAESEDCSAAALRLGVAADEADKDRALTDIIARCDADITRCDKTITDESVLRRQADEARKTLTDAQKERDEALTRRAEAEKTLRGLAVRIEEAEKSIAVNRENEARLAHRLGEVDGFGKYCVRAMADPKTFKERVEACRADFDCITKLIEENERECRRLSDLTDAGGRIRDAIVLAVPSWTDTEPLPSQTQETDVQDLLTDISAKARSAADRLTRASAVAARLEAEITTFVNDNPGMTRADLDSIAARPQSEILEAEAAVKEADDAVVSARAAVDTNAAHLKTLLESDVRPAEGDTPASLRSAIDAVSGTLDGLNRERGGLERRLAEDDEARRRQADLVRQADEARKEWQKWLRLNNLLGSATGDKFNRIAQSFVLERLLDNANVYLSRLTDRYRLRGVRGRYLILLEDSYNANACRPVVTSSGGESFMVSLALALALSDAGTSFSSDILFIDEGFGTLSGEPLRRAVAMLRSLHRTSRKRVGIISHVAQLRSEIPVQIQVTRSPGSGAGEINVVTIQN